jgi:acyl-coenzyme A synthetase/AMP-(fatty) acid ligase
MGHEDVKECVAVAVPDAEKGEVPMLFLTLREKDEIQRKNIVEDIKKMCMSNLKGEATPQYYEVLEEIPYTSNNKQDYRKLETLGKKLIEQF